MAEIILTIDGQLHRGWQSIAVARSIERVVHSFELVLSHRWQDADPVFIRSGQPCTIHLDDELLITGYTDAVAPNYDARSHSVSVQGRSAAADLADCSQVGQEYKNLDLLQIAEKLTAPFGIKVSATTPVGGAFGVVRQATGQTIFEFLEHLARIRAVRFISDNNGDLVITTAGSRYADTALVFGDNIKAAAGSFDLNQAFSDYLVVAQQDGILLSVSAQAEVSGNAVDSRVTRHRPIAIELDTAGDIAACRDRAEWERNTRYGRGQQVTYTVAGWQQTDGGRTWQPNELVQIDDPWQRISGEKGERLIVEARLIKDAEGTRTELVTMPRAAFLLEELPEPTVDGWAP